MSYKYVILCCVLSLLGGAYLHNKFAPARNNTIEVVRDNVVTVVKEVVKPDGTVIRDSVTTDKSVKRVDSVTQIAASKPDWLAGVKYNTNKEWSVGVSKRVLGNVYVGAEASQSGVLSATIHKPF